jgi:thioredoxin
MRDRVIYSLIVTSLVLFSCNQQSNNQDKSHAQINQEKSDAIEKTQVSDGDIKPVYLTTADFKQKIWDYDSNPQEFVYQGELPCVIDFYADWCRPCKMVAPIMDDLAEYYKGKVIIYKVNTDKERELASVFQVTSIPAILFTPMDGKPAMQPGALAKEDYIKIIDEFLLKLKTENSKKI